MLGRLGEIPVAVGEQCNFPLDKVPVEKQGESVQGRNAGGRLRRWSLRIIPVAKNAAVP